MNLNTNIRADGRFKKPPIPFQEYGQPRPFAYYVGTFDGPDVSMGPWNDVTPARNECYRRVGGYAWFFDTERTARRPFGPNDTGVWEWVEGG